MSLMTIMKMMVLGLDLQENLVYLVCALFNFLKFLLIMFVDCQVMEFKKTVVVSENIFSLNIFPLKSFSSFKFRFFFNIITVRFRLAA